MYMKDEFAAFNWETRFLFIEIDTYKVPFKIEEISDETNHILKLETLDSVEMLKPFLSKKIYVENRFLMNQVLIQPKENKYDYLKGYNILNQDRKSIGKISSIRVFPQQEMAVVIYKSNEVLLPLSPLLILEENHQLKTIQLDIAEGLLGLKF